MSAWKSRRAVDPVKARHRRLAAIHATANRLGLEDDVYRDLVERVSAEHGTPQRSAGKCTEKQQNAIATELRRLEGIPEKTARAARQWSGRPKGDLVPQMSKIEALLADAGREWAYAHSLAKRMCGVSRVDWCNPDQLGKVIAALQIDADRRARKGASP